MLWSQQSLFGDPGWDLTHINDLAALEEKVKTCRRCGLRSGCRGVVFGEGNPRAKLVLCGEGPGEDEDRLGRPFVGRAGQLLDKILAACGFERFTHVYILNAVKCRPPGNRIPTEEERAACRPNLEAQLRILRPRIIVLLGATALQVLLDPRGRISRDRGRWVERDGVWYMPTYHPAALLRNPNLKREAWEDFKQVVAKYRELIDPGHVAPYC
ncbi:uracil-DNA glycosylase [Desulfovirgula thermocuniculi]|uniref:uracil-DNA glycosylase n=1 Tax=Desulfovirgula thermocuniculi TaxID=348842 RepID=UPI00040EDA8B|nr:uracil-DNA glycosylase [Desulfovirgula thermocuniculi]